MILSTLTVIIVIAIIVAAYTLYTQNVFESSLIPRLFVPNGRGLERPEKELGKGLFCNIFKLSLIPKHRLPNGSVLQGPEKELGKGAFGTVSKYKLDGISVAVKMPNALADNELQRHELAILQKANPHPNVIKYLGTYTLYGKISIIMELMQGSLRDLLNKLPDLSWQTKLSLARQMTTALVHLHKLKSEGFTRKAIVHQDLKSDNLLVDTIVDSPNIKLKVTDFGVAREIEQVNIPFFGKRTSKMLAGQEAGTLLYMAPEVIEAVNKGEHICNTKSDIYSSGLILWEIATTKRPNRSIEEICQGKFGEFDNDKITSANKARSLLKRGAAMFEKPTYSYRQSSFFGSVIDNCINPKPSRRDSASKVLDKLQKIS
jgi:serine/threonine protein kinase